MKSIAAVTLLILVACQLRAQAPAAVSKAEQRLAQLLAPSSRVSDAAVEVAKSPPVAARRLERPELPLRSAPLPAPAPPKPESKPVQPRTLPEDPPLVRRFTEPEPPHAVEVPSQPLVRLWSPDVNEPLPLPILGKNVPDRASLGDPSLDASIAAAQAKLQPARSQPVPFQAMNLPEPFEHVRAVRLRVPLEEAPQPPLTLDTLGRR
jgi:hypothetical protein